MHDQLAAEEDQNVVIPTDQGLSIKLLTVVNCGAPMDTYVRIG
jgi:hypothetical protein